MTATVERLKNEIRSLPKDDLDDLLRDIQSEYVLPALDNDGKSVAADWDEEINRRAQEVMNGTAELISGEESDRMMDALYAKHGVQRQQVA